MDPGGVAEAELRNVDPVAVDSERTLRAELDKIGSSLALAVRLAIMLFLPKHPKHAAVQRS